MGVTHRPKDQERDPVSTEIHVTSHLGELRLKKKNHCHINSSLPAPTTLSTSTLLNLSYLIITGVSSPPDVSFWGNRLCFHPLCTPQG